jgi:hypothetical protein
MDVRFQGVLRDPLNNPLPDHEIRITALHTDETMKGTEVTFLTDNTGAYDFYLLNGFYSLEVMNVAEDEFLLTGNLVLNQTTPQNITLEEALKYSEDVVVPELITLDEPWLTWWNSLVNASLTTHREHRDQINNKTAKTLDLQETWESDDCTEHGAQRTTMVQTGKTEIETQERTFYDETDDQGFATVYQRVESDNAGYQHQKQADTSYKEQTLYGSDDATVLGSKTVDTDITEQETATTANGTWDKLKQLATTVRESLSMTFGSNTVDKVSEVGTDSLESYSSLIGSKTTSITHTNDGTTSDYNIVVDNWQVGKTPVSPTMYVDTATGKVTVYGQLQISELLDENGNPVNLDPQDGDTIFQVYQYSESNLGPWDDTVSPTDIWRRENWSINGVVDPDTWSAPYQFRGFDGSDGNPGDTIYIEYQYSPDGVTWHAEPLLSGDKWRRERVVTNGVPGPWSDPGRIVGDDGETIETRSEYSIDGIYNWHSTPDPADKWERRAVFVNGVQQGPWSDPIPFGAGNKGDTGEDGDTIFEESRYGPNETIDGQWTDWGGTQLDTHFWRQDRTVTNGVPGPAGVVYRIVGKPGSGWYTINNGTGNFPSDAQATVDFINNFGRSPTLDDHLTYTNNSNPDLVTNSSIKRCNSPEGSPVTWSTPAMVIQGDLIARGTISGDRLVANTITGNQISSATTIIAGSGSWTAGMNGNDLANAGDYRYWRFWAGATDPDMAPFRVYRNGSVFASDIEINGTGTFIGNVTASTLTLTGGTNITASDVGAETPAGAQSKANTAETNAKNASDPAGSAAAAQAAAATDATNKANAAQAAAIASSNGYTENRIYPDQNSIQIKSSNYSSGSTGWAIDADGDAEFNNVVVRGTGYFTDGVFDGTVYAEHISGDIVSARVKNNPASYNGYTPPNTYRDILDMMTITTTRPYDRHLQIGVTDGFTAIRVNPLASSPFADMNFTMELVHDNGTIVWSYTVPWNASQINPLQVTIPTINADIPANTPAGTYRLRVKSNREMDWIRYMQYTSGTNWLSYNSDLIGYLFKNSNELT